MLALFSKILALGLASPLLLGTLAVGTCPTIDHPWCIRETRFFPEWFTSWDDSANAWGETQHYQKYGYGEEREDPKKNRF